MHKLLYETLIKKFNLLVFYKNFCRKSGRHEIKFRVKSCKNVPFLIDLPS